MSKPWTNRRIKDEMGRLRKQIRSGSGILNRNIIEMMDDDLTIEDLEWICFTVENILHDARDLKLLSHVNGYNSKFEDGK